MHERAPLSKINQPPESLIKAVLISDQGDSIPIDNQTVQVYQFEHPGSPDFVDITTKTSRKRILLEDPRVIEVLSEMGCKTVSDHMWSSAVEPPSEVVAEGMWDVLDEAENKSLVLEVEKRGELIYPAKENETTSFTIPMESPILTLEVQGKPIKAHYFNTEVVEISEYPEMSHVIINVQQDDDKITPVYIFESPELMELLEEEEFDYKSKRYPDTETIEAFLQYEDGKFDLSATELLGDSENES